ncbi:NUDIX domain-containing protein [Brevibacillus sp. H7]|uniref:NUDIX domain-containing protein n=1 Tax=Brevibacillus sp. H7 TaxID=3349138 RepID=UPI00382E3FB7
MNPIKMRVTVVVEHQGSILLIKEKSGNELYYSLPGGSVEYLETIPEATRREVWEETGVLVEFVRMLWLDERIDKSGDGKHTVGVGVLARPVGEDSTPIPGGVDDEQIVWSGWVTLDQFRSCPLYNLIRRDQVIKALSEPDYKPDYIGNVI